MHATRVSLLLTVLLAGCSGPQGPWPAQGWPWPALSHAGYMPGTGKRAPAAEGAYSDFSFNWQLTGDPRIMPVQVFDDGTRMWLQFQPGSAWPAVFEAVSGGWRPLAYERDGPYMVLQGVYPNLALRGGHLHGEIRRVEEPNALARGGVSPTAPVAAPAAAAAPDARAAHPSVADAKPVPAPGTQVVPQGYAPALGQQRQKTASVESQPVDSIPVKSIAPDAALRKPVTIDRVPTAYAVSPADHTIRQALGRWAARAGWTFSAEHWAVDVDIPLVGSARFDSDFKAAVRELLAATEMGERPVQPCFYSNQVLRVVPYAQPCDRRKGMGAAS
ncbi:TrbG/VirB9 family P-type conjugative transfer protein [bacterium SGD-2]|nr:TrbG/VirB9 family P-type conjugative transfer protein [bacterium SGD-2]